MDARRAEEDHRVLDVLRFESTQRFEVLGEDTERASFLALEKLLVPVSKRLGMHVVILAVLGPQSAVHSLQSTVHGLQSTVHGHKT